MISHIWGKLGVISQNHDADDRWDKFLQIVLQNHEFMCNISMQNAYMGELGCHFTFLGS